MCYTSAMKRKRQAIYVDIPVYEEFKAQANDDNRKYSPFLEMLLKKYKKK